MARDFGRTWWGKAWLDSLEARALEDPNRLPRGRTYARQERVTDIELSPGMVSAQVWGSEPYRTSLHVRVLTDEQWNAVLDVIMAQASHAATLLAGEVPSSIGPMVLPDRGDLGPDCSCPDWAELCKHAAALCYTASDLFDADPFALLTLRGRQRDDVLREVRRRRGQRLGVDDQTTTATPRGADPGISASAAFKRPVETFERSAPIPDQPARLRPLAAGPPADSGIDHVELDELVHDAARRAWNMLADGQTSGLHLSVGSDVVRRATHGDIDRIATATQLDSAELRAAAHAWNRGGHAGFRALRDRFELPSAALAGAARNLGDGAKLRANTVTSGTTQLRIDHTGQWWRFEHDDELGWLLASGPVDDPADLT